VTVGFDDPDVPVPLTLIDCGLPVPVLMTDTDPVRAPAAPGLKERLTEQFAPALTVVHVEPATANSDGLLLLTLDTETAVPPVLVIVTLLAALVVPTGWLPKPIDVDIDNWPGEATDEPVPLVDRSSALLL
jgi:hypothetical protein